MEITITRSKAARKTNRLVIFDGGHLHGVQFLRTAFGETIPDTLKLTGEGFAAPKVKETPEERKIRLAAIMPAERLAKMEERVVKMKAKLVAAPPTTTEITKPEITKPAAHKAKK